MYRAVHRLGSEPVLYLHYEERPFGNEFVEVDRVVQSEGSYKPEGFIKHATRPCLAHPRARG